MITKSGHLYRYFIVTILLGALTMSISAEENGIQSMSEGACWYEQGEFLKVASFNDKETALFKRDDLDLQVEQLLKAQGGLKTSVGDFSLHCGGYGLSFIVRTEYNQRPACLWIGLEKGRFKLRSLGGQEDTKSDLCDGYKWGELIIGIKSPEQRVFLESEYFAGTIKSIGTISDKTLKLILHEEYYGKELEVMSDLKKKVDLKYIELNLYQHPVGETVPLK